MQATANTPQPDPGTRARHQGRLADLAALDTTTDIEAAAQSRADDAENSLAAAIRREQENALFWRVAAHAARTARAEGRDPLTAACAVLDIYYGPITETAVA